MGLKIYLNGNLVDKEEAKISIFDHGVLYGDGVFEGIRSYSRRVFRLDEHLDRLYKSADAIRLRIPISLEEFKQRIIHTLQANDIDDGYIRAVVTRGIGDLGLDPRKCPIPTIFIIADKIALYPKEFYENGLPIITTRVRRNHPESISPTIKSLNYLNSILGKIEAIDAGVNEAIMLTTDGYVAECTGDNIVVVKNGMLKTPPFEIGALEGITVKVVGELAMKKGLEFAYEMLKPGDVYSADELFLTGTAAEIVPVTSVDEHVIGTGKPGEITRSLMKDFHELTNTTGLEY